MEAVKVDFADPDRYPVDARGLTYSYAYIGLKRLGAGQFYLISIKDKAGNAFDGGKTYRLTVSANAPVEQYWSATAYDRVTQALIRNMPRASRSSQIPEMQKNADGSVDVYFGGTQSKGARPGTRKDAPIAVVLFGGQASEVTSRVCRRSRVCAK